MTRIAAPQASQGSTSVSAVVDRIMGSYDASGDGTLTYGFGGEHGVTGEALRTATVLEQSPHGPLVRVEQTIAIQALITAADAVDGAINGSVDRMDLMAVIGALDLHGGSDPATGSRRDGQLDHQEYLSYERLFRERVVDRANAEVVIPAGPRHPWE